MSETEGFYKISQVAKICSISRATILRMEEDGLLTPAYKDSRSGYRYYDVQNIFSIRQILLLREYGFQKEQIRSFLNDPSDVDALIQSIRKRLQLLNRTLDTLKTNSIRRDDFQLLTQVFPKTNYYSKKLFLPGPRENVRKAVYQTMAEAISKGYHPYLYTNILIVADPEYFMRTDDNPEKKYSFIINLPVKESSGDGITLQPSTVVLYFLWDGSKKTIGPGIEHLRAELKKRGITPLAPLGVDILLSDFYSEKELDRILQKRNFARIGVPIELAEESDLGNAADRT